MAKKGYIGITSYDWWDFLKERKLEKINFWNKKDKFNCLQEGDYFFFLKKNSKDETGERKIVGYATFLEFRQLSFIDAWSEFGEGNGSTNIKDFSDDCKAMLGDTSLEKIGCIVLTDLTVFENPVFLSSLSIPFENAIVSGKSIDEVECKLLLNHSSNCLNKKNKRFLNILIKDSADYEEATVLQELESEFKNYIEEYKSSASHIFGIQYVDVLDKFNINEKQLLSSVGISENYNVELNKGKRIYNYLKNRYETSGYTQLNTNITKNISFPHNRIIFGAPGTGKSHQLDSDLKDECGANYFTYHERVTFHPSYSYANFVGTYKPVKDEKGNGQITYEFVEGPFIRILRQALNNPEQNYLLIIEEINRANVTAVFGDVFQLLDRDSNNISQYEVAASEDLRKHLLNNGVSADKATVLRIPENMYIWATMNSADQGVQPLDTAFKRRWEFEYLNINNSEDKIAENMKNIQFPDQTMEWNLLRHLINNRLSANYNINEDKLLGPFFIKKGNHTNDQFITAFKSKVLMYLFEDVCKINPKLLFAGIKCEGKIHFSKIIEQFDANGIGIFGFSSSEIDSAEKEIQKNKPKTEAADAE